MVIGNRRTRTPVACHTALATAPAEPVIPISPTPLMPSAFTCGSCSSIRMASSDGTSAFTGMWYSARFAFMTRPERGSSKQGRFIEREGDTPDHAAVVLAAHEPRVDDGAGRESADQTRRPDLPQLRVNLHLGEHGAVHVHGVGLLRERISAGAAASFDLGEAGAGQDVGIALAAALVVAAGQPAAPCQHAGIVGTKQRRAFISHGQFRQLGDHVDSGAVYRHAGGRGVGGAPGNARIRQVGAAGPELQLVELKTEAVRGDLCERSPGALAHVLCTKL